MTCGDSGHEPLGTLAPFDIEQESGGSSLGGFEGKSPSPAYCRNHLSNLRARRVPVWTVWDPPCRDGDNAVPRATKAPSSRRQHPPGDVTLQGWRGGVSSSTAPGVIPCKTFHLRTTAACTGQARSTVGSSTAMCFELFSPNLLRGPVQALMMHSPEPRPLQEKLSQYYSLGESISQKSLKQGSDLSSSGCAFS